MWSRIKKSWWFRLACLLGALIVVGLVALVVATGLALMVPVLAVWGAWEWFVGRHKPTMTLEEELAELVRDHG